MRTYNDNTQLTNFKFWSGAVALAEKLTYTELELIQENLCDLYPEGMSETYLNDLFWFEQDFICEIIGETAEDVYNRE